MTRHIAWIVKQPFQSRDFARLGIAAARVRGWAATILDLSAALHPEMGRHRSLAPEGVNVLSPTSGCEIAAAAASLGGVDLLVVQIAGQGLSRLSLSTMRALSRLDCYMLVMAPQPTPFALPGVRGNFRNTFVSALARLSRFDPLNATIGRLPAGVLGVRSADFVMYGCLGSERFSNNLIGPATRPIYTHSWDFEVLRRLSANLPPIRDIAVFIDQYVPFHPDALVIGARAIDPLPYYASLNRLFELVQSSLGIEVVVAAHPRSDYGNKAWAFPRVRVEVGRTHSLIAESRLVLGHYSTALNVAAALGKPIILLTSHGLMRRDGLQLGNYHGFAQALKIPFYYLDEIEKMDFEQLMATPVPNRESYIANFLRHPNDSGGPLWESVFENVFSGSFEAAGGGNSFISPLAAPRTRAIRRAESNH